MWLYGNSLAFSSFRKCFNSFAAKVQSTFVAGFFFVFFFLFFFFKLLLGKIERQTVHDEPSHLDLCYLQKPIISAYDSERVKETGFTWWIFRHFYQERQILSCSVFLTARHAPPKEGSSIKGKKLLQLGVISFLFSRLLFIRGQNLFKHSYSP